MGERARQLGKEPIAPLHAPRDLCAGCAPGFHLSRVTDTRRPAITSEPDVQRPKCVLPGQARSPNEPKLIPMNPGILSTRNLFVGEQETRGRARRRSGFAEERGHTRSGSRFHLSPTHGRIMNKLSLVLLTSGIANAGYVAMNNYETEAATLHHLEALTSSRPMQNASTLPQRTAGSPSAKHDRGSRRLVRARDRRGFRHLLEPKRGKLCQWLRPCACKQPPTSAPTAAPSTVAPSKSPTVSPTASPVTSSPQRARRWRQRRARRAVRSLRGRTRSLRRVRDPHDLEDAARSAIISNVGISVNQLSTSSSCGSVILTFSISICRRPVPAPERRAQQSQYHSGPPSSLTTALRPLR